MRLKSVQCWYTGSIKWYFCILILQKVLLFSSKKEKTFFFRKCWHDSKCTADRCLFLWAFIRLCQWEPGVDRDPLQQYNVPECSSVWASLRAACTLPFSALRINKQQSCWLRSDWIPCNELWKASQQHHTVSTLCCLINTRPSHMWHGHATYWVKGFTLSSDQNTRRAIAPGSVCSSKTSPNVRWWRHFFSCEKNEESRNKWIESLTQSGIKWRDRKQRQPYGRIAVLRAKGLGASIWLFRACVSTSCWQVSQLQNCLKDK